MSVLGILDAARSEFPATVRLVWICLENHANGHRWWPITVNAIADEMHFSRPTVLSALAALENSGIIRREMRQRRATIIHMLRCYDHPVEYAGHTETAINEGRLESEKFPTPADPPTDLWSENLHGKRSADLTPCTQQKESTRKEDYPPVPPQGGDCDNAVSREYPFPGDAQQGKTVPLDAGEGDRDPPASDRQIVAVPPPHAAPQNALQGGEALPPSVAPSLFPDPCQRTPSAGRGGNAQGEPRGFEEFYAAYPRKVGRRAAANAFRAAIKRASIDEIIAGLRCATFSADPQFRPHPATWLNQDRWLDDPTPPPAPSPPFDPRKLTGFAAVAWEARRELAELDAAEAAEAALAGVPALIDGRAG